MRGGYRYFTSVENEVIRATTRQDVWLVSQNIDTALKENLNMQKEAEF